LKDHEATSLTTQRNVHESLKARRYRLQSVPGVAIRFMIYSLVLLAGYALLPELIRQGDVVVFKEGGPTEWLQFILLVLTACVFMVGSVRFRARRQWFLLLAALTSIACIRELDSLFDALLPYVGWQLPAILALCVGLVAVLRNPRRFLMQAEEPICRRGCAILWSGFVVAVIFAQLVGHEAFLEAVMTDDYVRDYKRVIEELAELFGYALLLIGSVESLLEAPSSE